jgi:hypothetical protein
LGSWGIPARTHPRTPAPTNVNLGAPDRYPGGASASMGSLRFSLVICSLHLLSSSSLSSGFLFLPPFSCLPGELRAFALLGAPLLPLPSGTPLLPRHPGATGGRQFPPSLLGRGMMVPIHHPSRGGSRRTRGSPGPPPPSSGRSRRGGAAPAFVGGPNSSPSAPRVLPQGLGNRSRLS